MKTVSRVFANPSPSQLGALTGGDTVPQALKDIAGAFVDLQDARLQADYDVTRSFTPNEVEELVKRAREAFRLWEMFKTDPLFNVFLMKMLLGKWQGRGNT